jgi:hypothetical protein
MDRSVARLSAVLVISAAFGLATAAPALAAQGVTVQVTQLPGEFAAGGPPAPVTVVASRSRSGCIKVRWSLVLRVEGARLDRVRVDRIEESGSFPVNVRTTGNTARITDRQLDPGTLCRDRTVTARYEISFAGDAADAAAEATLAAEAFSAGGQLLDRATVTREVQPADASAPPEPTADAATPAQSGRRPRRPAAGSTRTGRVAPGWSGSARSASRSARSWSCSG